MVGQGPTLRETSLSIGGKGPPRSSRSLGGQHVLSRHFFMPSTATHISSFMFSAPQKIYPISTCRSTPCTYVPMFLQTEPSMTNKGSFFWKTGIARLEWEGCGLTVRRSGLGPSSNTQRNVKVAGEALVWSNREFFWDSVSNGAVFKLFIGQET